MSCSNFQSNPSLLAYTGHFLGAVERLRRHQGSDGRKWGVDWRNAQLAFSRNLVSNRQSAPLYGTAVCRPFLALFPHHSAIAREQSIVKVSVYTLQFMFIKIKWETREGRREKLHWGGREGGRTQDQAWKSLCEG